MKRLCLIGMIIIIVGMIIVGIIATVHVADTFKNTNNYTTSYETINVSTAKQLIDENNITIVDGRGGCKPCNQKKGRILQAVWGPKPEKFYNTTEDLLIYCMDGKTSKTFCEQLIGHVYGKIYHLEGGFNAWVKG